MRAWAWHDVCVGFARRPCEGVGKDAARADNQARAQGGGAGCGRGGGGLLILALAGKPAAGRGRAGGGSMRAWALPGALAKAWEKMQRTRPTRHERTGAVRCGGGADPRGGMLTRR